jgi:hypothetical protein
MLKSVTIYVLTMCFPMIPLSGQSNSGRWVPLSFCFLLSNFRAQASTWLFGCDGRGVTRFGIKSGRQTTLKASLDHVEWVDMLS